MDDNTRFQVCLALSLTNGTRAADWMSPTPSIFSGTGISAENQLNIVTQRVGGAPPGATPGKLI